MDLFWEPEENFAVTVEQHTCQASYGEAAGCAGYESVAVASNYWNQSHIWVHELTHVLQLTGSVYPALAVGDANLLYIAEASAEILVPTNTGLNCCRDHAFATVDFRVAGTAWDYQDYHRIGETHVDWQIWISLHEAEPQIFREINQRLYQYAAANEYFTDLPSFRELIAEVSQIQVVNGFPIKQWLAIEGFLGQDELGSTNPYFSINIPSYFPQSSSQYYVGIISALVTTASQLRIDRVQSHASVYDALSRVKLADMIPQFPVNDPNNPGIGFVVLLNTTTPPPVVRVDVHVVSGNVVFDRSLFSYLMKPLCENGCPLGINGNGLVLFPTSDGWLQQLSGVITANGQNFPIQNGVGIVTVNGPTTLSDSNGVIVTNFIPNTILTIGLSYSALDLMQNANTITLQGGITSQPTTTTQTTTSTSTTSSATSTTSSTTSTSQTTPDFTISVQPAVLTMQTNSATTFNFTLASVNSWQGGLTLQMSSLPSGIATPNMPTVSFLGARNTATQRQTRTSCEPCPKPVSEGIERVPLQQGRSQRKLGTRNASLADRRQRRSPELRGRQSLLKSRA